MSSCKLLLNYLCLIIILSVNKSCADTNLLINISFESEGNSFPVENWYTYHDSYTRSANFCKTGNWSCRILGTGGTNEIGLGGMRQDIYQGLPEQGKFLRFEQYLYKFLHAGQNICPVCN